MSPGVPNVSVVSYVVKQEKGLAVTGVALSDFGRQTGKILLRCNHKGEYFLLQIITQKPDAHQRGESLAF